MPDVPMDSETDEYELLPHREIEDLKEELSKLKEFEIAPSKKLHVSLLELNTKLDKLITIFEDATHELRIEEGGISFTEKMRPVLEKMNKILEQNSEIASGILALADMVKEVKESRSEPIQRMPEPIEEPPMPAQYAMPRQPVMMGTLPPPPAPMKAPIQMSGQIPPGVPPGLPLPPMPRKRTFGL